MSEPTVRNQERVVYPAVEAGKLQPPAFLDAEARKLWCRLVPILVKARVLTEGDTEALAMLCNSWSTYLAATATLATEGRILSVGTNGAKYPHPAVNDQRSALADFNRLSAKFGLTPKDRERLTAQAPQPEPDDPVVTRLFSSFALGEPVTDKPKGSRLFAKGVG